MASFTAIEYWNREVSLVMKGTKDAPIKVLLGNKGDLNHLQVVDNEQHDHLVKELKMESYIGSAKTGDQINQMFFKIAADLAGIKVTAA